jgi:hypothetical protein
LIFWDIQLTTKRKGNYIMEIDLSLNRSLEELISSYWEASNSELDLDDEIHNAFYALEDYLSGMGAL